MVRKQGGLLDVSFAANENVVDRCLAKVKEVEPKSLADKLYHVTIKAEAIQSLLWMDLITLLMGLEISQALRWEVQIRLKSVI